MCSGCAFYLLWKKIKVGARGSTHAKFRCLEAPENVLQSCSNEEVFLLQTQLFAFKELQTNVQPTHLYVRYRKNSITIRTIFIFVTSLKVGVRITHANQSACQLPNVRLQTRPVTRTCVCWHGHEWEIQRRIRKCFYSASAVDVNATLHYVVDMNTSF